MTHWHRPMRREPPLVPLPKKVPPIGTTPVDRPHHADTHGPADGAVR
jgi:hypothetical protein